jgi:hypothetical protein
MKSVSLDLRRYFLWCVVLIGVTVISSAAIGFRTKIDAHPDEIYHLDAFCYFENHWWYPDIGANGLRYGPFGDARAVNPEIVYWLFGRTGAVIKPFTSWIVHELGKNQGNQSLISGRYKTYFPVISSGDYCRTIPLIYRFQNIALLLFTLITLFWIGSKYRMAFITGVMLICIPQLVYVYSYANADAWGISFSVLITMYVLVQPQPFSSLKKSIVMALLVGAVLLSKQNYWLSLIVPICNMGYDFFKSLFSNKTSNSWRSIHWKNLLVFLGLLVILVTPGYIIYPFSQNIDPWRGIGQFARIDEDRAAIGYKLENPTMPGFNLKGQGVKIGQVWTDRTWFDSSLKSFYGQFGYFRIEPPEFAYPIAALIAALNVFITIVMAAKHWNSITVPTKLILLLSPVIIALTIALSVYNSWAVDYQPQGRYFFPVLTVLPFLMAGTIDLEGNRTRPIRIISAIILFGLSILILWISVILNPKLL